MSPEQKLSDTALDGDAGKYVTELSGIVTYVYMNGRTAGFHRVLR